MGGGSWSSASWNTYASVNVTGKSTQQIFTSRGIDPLLDPKGVETRESRDSIDNPESTALAVFVDVTGSMGMLSEAMVRSGCNTLATEIHSRKPITCPHIMFGAIGDVNGDTAPLQVSQYEADLRIVDQLTKVYLEGGGLGNGMESYSFPWYFAALHTSLDCFEKRNKKGYLFTIGDDGPEMKLRAAHIEKYLGYNPEKDFTAEELLVMVSRKYEVFHLIIKEGGTYSSKVEKQWKDLLGERAIVLLDHTKMAEVIVSLIQSIEGTATKDEIIGSWTGDTSIVVQTALNELQSANKNNTAGIVSF